MELLKKSSGVKQMDATDKVKMMAELAHDYCSLNHGQDIRNENIPAADYIVMPFGYEESKDKEIAVRELIIPVCSECVQALKGNEWTLLFCFECAESRWVCRKLAKNRYRHHILWLRGCPDCTNAFGGLYFSESASHNCIPLLSGNEMRIAV